MPQEFSAVLVKGRSNYLSLRRLDAAVGARRRRRSSSRRSSTSSREIRLWAGRTERRQPVRPRLPARCRSVWDAVAERERQLPGPRLPAAQGLLLLQGPPADVDGQPPGRQPRPVHERPGPARGSGVGLLPDYDVAIFDEAHTLEAVAGEHLGLQVTNAAVEYTLARLYNDRTGKGLLAYHQLDEAIEQVRRGPAWPRDDFFDDVADWQRQARARPTAGSASRSPGPTRSARSCASWPRPSTGAPTTIEEPRSSGSS